MEYPVKLISTTKVEEGQKWEQRSNGRTMIVVDADTANIRYVSKGSNRVRFIGIENLLREFRLIKKEGE
jgi:hypothetical protein